MFTEYQEDVVREYRRKKATGDLTDNLKSGTTAKLQAECADICASRYLRQDERALARYFKVQTDQQGYRDIIKDKDPDDFKAVYKFLRGQTKNPNEEIVELLAWLIDFQPRPYLRWMNERPEKKQEVTVDRKTAPEQEPAEAEIEGVVGEIEVKGEKTSKTRLITIVVSISFAAVFMVYWIFKPAGPLPPKPLPGKTVSATAKCMYWKEDHYEATACGQGPPGILTLPLDSEKLLHLRKIANPKTSVTYASIGHVWYFKTPDSLECFTAGGAYPLDTNRRLLPITRYMIDHHILPKHE